VTDSPPLGYDHLANGADPNSNRPGRHEHGRQDTEASAEDQEAEADFCPPDQERLVAPKSEHARASSAGRRFRRHEVELAEGGKLVLHTDGSISQLDAEGQDVAKWAAEDPDWPRHAIRFGLFPQPSTNTPADTREKGFRPQD
jgi:hypothetical protein